MDHPDVIVVGNVTYNTSNLSQEEILRLHNMKIIESHRGHEAMHLEIFFICVFGILISQLLLVIWKKQHFRSYRLVTLFGMWIVPFIYSLSAGFVRFIFIWFLFSLVTGSVIFMASKRKISTKTPRRVYRWFLFVLSASYLLGVGGCALFFATICGLTSALRVPEEMAVTISILSIFYGVYYGVVSRDCAEVCTEKMAAQIGYSVPTGMPLRRLDPTVCSICSDPLQRNADGRDEKVYQLDCSHSFHDFCIRGWCIVGKKDICPYCSEKVDLKRTFNDLWHRPQLVYGDMLDFVRYMVAWQPVILFFIILLSKLLDLK